MLDISIENVHERKITAPANQVGALLDSASSSEDRVWPYENWSNIELDRPLGVGARGGHGSIKYEVTSYIPGNSIKFEFTKDLNGYHEMVIKEIDATHCLLRHSIHANVTGSMLLLWPTVIRPLHNALIEDLLDKVEMQVSSVQHPRRWSIWVTLLRRMRGMHSSKKPLDIE